MRNRRALRRSDLLSGPVHEAHRPDFRCRMSEARSLRSLQVSPACALYFESWDSLWFQIQEAAHAPHGRWGRPLRNGRTEEHRRNTALAAVPQLGAARRCRPAASAEVHQGTQCRARLGPMHA